MVKFSGNDEEHPFTAVADDVELHGQEIFSACVRGDAGAIGEYKPALTAEKAREQKSREINAWRDTEENSGVIFDWNGHRWDGGKLSQSRLEPVLTVAKAGQLPAGFFWTDADNNDVPVTADDLLAIDVAMTQAMVIQGFKIHERQRRMKKAIEGMTNADAILNYPVGWEKEIHSGPE
ncbi:DUF4376 domain-containing protein [Escherichia coli]